MVEKNTFEKNMEYEYPEEVSLGRRAVKGGVWIFALKLVHRVLGLARTIILARLLFPRDFGLMGIAIITIDLVETFSKLGVETALIQKKGKIEEYLNTAWTILVFRSLLLFAALYLSAPFVATFFNNADAVIVIRILAFIEFFKAAQNIGVIYFKKDLRFDKSFIFQFSSLISNMLVSITLAFILRNVWALVYGSLAGSFTSCVMSYVMHPYRPKFHINIALARNLIHFGKWIFASSILFFIVTRGDSAFVGRILGVTALGFYEMASRLSNIVGREIRNVIFIVLFPAYSKIQHDLERLRKAYIEVLQLSNFIIVPVLTGIFLLASDFTRLFLGGKWMPMVPAMKVMAISGLLFSIGSTANVMFYARGKPKIETLWHFIQLIILAALIYPLSVRWNIMGTAMALCVSTGVWMAGFLSSLLLDLKLRLVDLIKAIVFPIVNSAFIVIILVFLKQKMGPVDIFGFVVLIIVALIVYVVANTFCSKCTDYNMFRLIKERTAQAIR